MPNSFVHVRTFRLAIRAPNNGQLISAGIPDFPYQSGDFGTEQTVADLEKATPACGRQPDRGSGLPALSSQSKKGLLRLFAGAVAAIIEGMDECREAD